MHLARSRCFVNGSCSMMSTVPSAVATACLGVMSSTQVCLISFLFSTSLLRYQCIRGCRFLGTLTLKPNCAATISSPPRVHCQDWVLFPPSPLRSAGVAQPWSSSRGPPLRCTEESFRESVSTLEYWGHALAFVGWRDQQSRPLLHPTHPVSLAS